MKWILTLLLVIGLSSSLVSCVSSENTNETAEGFAEETFDDFTDEEDDFGDEDEGDESDFAESEDEDFFDEEEGDEFADDSEDAEDGFEGEEEEDFADDDFSEDEFGEDEEFADEDFAEESDEGEFAEEEFDEEFDEFASEDDEFASEDDEFADSEEEGLDDFEDSELAEDDFGDELEDEFGEEFADEFAEDFDAEGDSLDSEGDSLAEEVLDEELTDPLGEGEELVVEASPQAGDQGFEEEPLMAESQNVPPEAAILGEPMTDQAVANSEETVSADEGAMVVSELPSAEEAVVDPSTLSQVSNISFLAQEVGGTVVIETSDQVDFQVRFKPDTRQYIVEIMSAILPQKLTRPFITKEFAQSQIGSVNAYQSPGSSVARVVVQMKEGAPQPLIEQRGNEIYVAGGLAAQSLALGGPVSPDVSEELAEPLVDSSVDPSVVNPVDPVPPSQVTAQTVVPGVSNDPLVSSTLTPRPVSAPGAQGGAPAPAVGGGIQIFGQVGPNGEQVLRSQTLDEFLSTNERFYGKPINVEVTNAEVTDVLRFISEQSGLNLVVSSDVSGQVDLKLREIPWDQALIIVLRSQGLGYQRQGNVLRVAPLSRLRAEAQDALRLAEDKLKAQPLAVKVVPVSYNDVGTMVTQVQTFLSERGKVSADSRTSTLVISDLPEKIAIAEKLIQSLDIAPPQVMIEGRIVEATDSFTKELGVNWNFSGEPVSLGQSGGNDVDLTPSLSVSPTGDTVGAGGLQLDLNVGTLAVFGDIGARLGLFERESKVKLLSSPRITTLTNEKATINQRTQIPLISTSIDEGVSTRSVTFKDVSLQLDVTPQITVDDSILLDVNLLREFAGEIVDSDTQARAVNSRQATVKVLVKNGQTAVIGGVYQSDVTETETGVPYLRNIPLLGAIFESKSRTTDKNELLIFLTPRVIEGSISGTN